jgi:hypothetical protein
LATLKNTGYDATLTLPAQGATVARPHGQNVGRLRQQGSHAGGLYGQPDVVRRVHRDRQRPWVKADFGPLARI